MSLPLPRYEYISNRAISPRFVGYRKIHGVTFDHERLAACCSDPPLRQLAQFLTELHGLPIERAQAAGLTLPTLDERRAEWLHWRNQIHQHVFPLLDERQHAWATRTLSDLLSDNALLDYTPTLRHGDLWAEHILFDPARETLTGVILTGRAPASATRPAIGRRSGSITATMQLSDCSPTIESRSTRLCVSG